jgi:hypothetical protein
VVARSEGWLGGEVLARSSRVCGRCVDTKHCLGKSYPDRVSL